MLEWRESGGNTGDSFSVDTVSVSEIVVVVVVSFALERVGESAASLLVHHSTAFGGREGGRERGREGGREGRREEKKGRRE